MPWYDIIDDNYEDTPLEPGWYAVLYAWSGSEDNEGIATDGLWWNGEHWGEFFADRGWRGLNTGARVKFHDYNISASFFPWRFASQKDAADFARRNEPYD